MAKVSALTAAGALDFTEIAYVVQGGASKRTTVAAMRAVGSGATTELVFRDAAGAPKQAAGTSWDDTNRALTLTGATVTASKPVLDLSQTWNAGGVVFSGLKLNVTNTASAAGSKLMELQLGGANLFAVDKAGIATAYTVNAVNLAGGSGTCLVGSSANTNAAVQFKYSVSDYLGTGGTSVGYIGRVSSNFGFFDGGGAALLTFRGDKGAVFTGYTTSLSTTVGALPSAATAGASARAFVTDASSPVFGSNVAGGGAVGVPVYSDGSNWKVG